MTIETLLKMLEEADDDALLMSIKDCHVIGLHSIVLKNDNGKLTRCYITSEDHELHNSSGLHFIGSLGVHDHLYDIRLRSIKSVALNITFVENKSIRNVDKYTFNSVVSGGNGATFDCVSGLEISSIEFIEDLTIKAHELHTVHVRKGDVCCWLVDEGVKIKGVNNLFTNNPPIASDHSRFKSAQEVREFMIDLLGR